MDRRRFVVCALASPALCLPSTPALAQVKAKKVRILNTRISSAKRSYNYKLVADPTNSAPSKRVERFELHGGDCGNKGECTPRPLNGRLVSRARTERVLLTDMNNGEEGLLSYSLFLPSDQYNIVTQLGSTFGQLLANFSRSPDSDGRPIFSIDTDEGASSRVYAQLSEARTHVGRTANSKQLTLGKLQKNSPLMDRWIKIEAYFRLSTETDGYIELHVNRRPMGRFVGRTMLPGGALEVRYGIYQTGTNQYPGGANAIPPLVAYFSDVKILRHAR